MSSVARSGLRRVCPSARVRASYDSVALPAWADTMANTLMQPRRILRCIHAAGARSAADRKMNHIRIGRWTTAAHGPQRRGQACGDGVGLVKGLSVLVQLCPVSPHDRVLFQRVPLARDHRAQGPRRCSADLAFPVMAAPGCEDAGGNLHPPSLDKRRAARRWRGPVIPRGRGLGMNQLCGCVQFGHVPLPAPRRPAEMTPSPRRSRPDHACVL